MKNFIEKNRSWFYLLSVHVSVLLFFFLFRIGLFLVMKNTINDGLSNVGGNIVNAFLMGLRFDNVIACYVMLLPILVVGVSQCFSFCKRSLFRGLNVYFGVLYGICLFICAANIPYFKEFFKPINASIWNWVDEPSFVFNMLTQEKSFVVFLFIAIAFVAGFCFLLKFLRKKIIGDGANCFDRDRRFVIFTLLATIILLPICFLGIRGRLGQKSPIRIGTAYFCNDPFLNQMGLNPVFVLLDTSLSMSDEQAKMIRMMDNDKAIENAKRYLNVAQSMFDSPIARMDSSSHAVSERKNVILILMESMASHFVDDTSLTPFLNELIHKSTFYPNTFSSGIHTMNGVFSTLVSSFPALMNQHPMKTGDILLYNGWMNTMKENGYSTLYFSTHDEQFDNIGGYLTWNGLDLLTAEKDYPAKEIRSNLGVCDDYMFRVSIPIINKYAEERTPFFASFLTASNHAPHIIPEYFVPNQNDPRYQVIEYSDYSLRLFFEEAKKQSWFHNTLFVLCADHGASANEFDVPLSYHHIPFVIYDPSNESFDERPDLAGQIDVFPTVMGRLGIPFINNSFGMDLTKEKRSMLVFSSDDSYCAIDSVHYFVHRLDGTETLSAYKININENILQENSSKVDSMREYAVSTIQAAQYIIDQRLTYSKMSSDVKK